MAALLPPPRLTGVPDDDLFNINGYLNVLARAIRGGVPEFGTSVTVSGTDTTASVTFARERADANYRVIAQLAAVVGAPTTSAFFVTTENTASGFTVTLLGAPSAGNAVTFDLLVIPEPV